MSTAVPVVSSSEVLSSTSGGIPIVQVLYACYVCQRQFKTESQLKRHENESALHKSNIAALVSSGQSVPTGPVIANSQV